MLCFLVSGVCVHVLFLYIKRWCLFHFGIFHQLSLSQLLHILYAQRWCPRWIRNLCRTLVVWKWLENRLETRGINHKYLSNSTIEVPWRLAILLNGILHLWPFLSCNFPMSIYFAIYYNWCRFLKVKHCIWYDWFPKETRWWMQTNLSPRILMQILEQFLKMYKSIWKKYMSRKIIFKEVA